MCFGDGGAAGTIGGPTQLAATATLLTVVAFFALDELVDLPTWVWPVGIAIAWAGIALRLWAVSTLGSQFSRVVRVEAGGHVEQRGPYRYVRHPS